MDMETLTDIDAADAHHLDASSPTLQWKNSVATTKEIDAMRMLRPAATWEGNIE